MINLIMILRFMRTRNIFWLLKLLICMVALCNISFGNAETIMLASKGKAFYRIGLPEYASLSEKFAAEELEKYLEQISRANFEITHQHGDHFILVCSMKSLKRMENFSNIPYMGEQEYGFFKHNNDLLLIGGSEGAILYAVYDFLTSLGCRWLAPQFSFYEGKSQSIPTKTELNIEFSGDFIRKPAFKYRKLYIEEGLSHNIANLKELIDWMPKVRFNVLVVPVDYQGKGRVKWDNWREQLSPELKKRGIIIEVGGHGYQNFLNAGMDSGQLFKNHPEWFGMDKNGNRSLDPHIVFCTSNPAAVSYLHNNLLSYLNAHPEIDIFDFWPPDSEKWCTCPECEALGNPSERHVLFVNQTARFLKNKCASIKLECLAYSQYTKPPTQIFLDEDVLLDFCPINQSFEYQIYDERSENNKFYKENLLLWRKLFKGDISIYSYYRKYAWRSLPNIIPHYMQNDVRFYHDCGIRGISVYSEPGDWFTYGLNHYILAHLAWNPEVDVDKLIGDYCAGVYGSAAKLVISVYDDLEHIVRFACKIPHTKQKKPEQYAGYFERLEICSSKVNMAVGEYSIDEVLAHHLRRLGLMVEYAKQSTLLMKFASEGNEQEMSKIMDNINKLIQANSAMGVFIPR